MARPTESFDFGDTRLNGVAPVSLETDYSDQGTPMHQASLQSFRTQEQARLETQLEHAENGKLEWKKRYDAEKALRSKERRELNRQIGDARAERDLARAELTETQEDLQFARTSIDDLERNVKRLKLEEQRATEFSNDLRRVEAELERDRESLRREKTSRKRSDRRIKELEADLTDRDETQRELKARTEELQSSLRLLRVENAQVVKAKTATPTIPERVDSSKPSPGLGPVSLNAELRGRFGSRSPAKNLLTRSPGLAKRGGGPQGTPSLPPAHPRDRFRALAAGATPAEETRGGSPSTTSNAAAAAAAAADAAALADALARELDLKRARERDAKALDSIRAELHELKLAHAELKERQATPTVPPPLDVSRASSEATESRARVASENNRKALEKARRLMTEVESLGHYISCLSRPNSRPLGPTPWEQIDEAHVMSKQELLRAIQRLQDVCPESVDPATVPMPVKVSPLNTPAASAVLSLMLWGLVMFVVDSSFLQS